jgi:putative oxidoreductase
MRRLSLTAQEAAQAGSRCEGASLEEDLLMKTVAILVARLIFAGVFAMAAIFKFGGMSDTAGYIAAAGFPFPLLLAWLAAIFEVALVLALLTGAFFREAALLAGVYVIFLAFAFHGPSHWEGNQMEFGLFVDHFTFLAGLLFAAVHGPGELAMRQGFIGKHESAS